MLTNTLQILAMAGFNAGVSYLNARMLNVGTQNAGIPGNAGAARSAALYGAAATLSGIAVGSFIFNNGFSGTKEMVEPLLRDSNPVAAGLGMAVGYGMVLVGGIAGTIGGLVSGIFIGKAATHFTSNPLSGKDVALLTGAYVFEAGAVLSYCASKN